MEAYAVGAVLLELHGNKVWWGEGSSSIVVQVLSQTLSYFQWRRKKGLEN